MKRILTLLLSTLLAVPAFADTCAKGLTGVFTSYQAKKICDTFSAGMVGTIANNTYATARNAANSANINVWKVDATDDLILNSDAGDVIKHQIGGDANRLFTWDAASDSALSMTWGDGGTTATQILTLSASTSDGDDDSSLVLAGGGASGATRGSSITLAGEEVAGGGDITYNTGTGDTHIFQIAGTTEETFDDDTLIFSGNAAKISGVVSVNLQVNGDANRLHTFAGTSDTALTYKFGDGGTTAVQQLTISASTADGDDDSSLILAGGGADGGTRGSSITLAGEEVASGGDITYNAGAGDSHIFNVAGTTFATIDSNSLDTGIATDADVTNVTSFGTGLLYSADSASNITLVNAIATNTGSKIGAFKTRSTATDANTIVASGDRVLQLVGYAADGAAYINAAEIRMTVDGTPGSNDMPGAITFLTTPDGSTTLTQALKLDQAQNTIAAGTITSTRTTDLGWAIVDGADNTACTTICTSAAVFGINLAAGATAPVIVGPADATADVCECAGAS